MSPEYGSTFISAKVLLIRCRSFAGMDRNARWALLASRKSQFILKSFQTDRLAAREVLLALAYCFDFVR